MAMYSADQAPIPGRESKVRRRSSLKVLRHESKLRVVVDKKLVTGQNQWSASEYALQLYHLLTGSTPVVFA